MGNNAIVDLLVTFKKPDNKNRIGGERVNRIIKLSASLCKRDILTRPDINSFQNACDQSKQRLVEGPNEVVMNDGSTEYWAICEDCSVGSDNKAITASTSPITTCNSLSAGAGVNLDNLTKMQCLNMGGTLDSTTGACDLTKNNKDLLFGGKTKDQCIDAGGVVVKVFHAGSGKMENICRFDRETCPSNWGQLDNWSTTVSSTCNADLALTGALSDSSKIFNCLQFFNLPSTHLYNRGIRTTTITEFHNWGNITKEETIYYTKLCLFRSGGSICDNFWDGYQSLPCSEHTEISMARRSSTETKCQSLVINIGCI
jgi:hypothetical protein